MPKRGWRLQHFGMTAPAPHFQIGATSSRRSPELRLLQQPELGLQPAPVSDLLCHTVMQLTQGDRSNSTTRQSYRSTDLQTTHSQNLPSSPVSMAVGS